MQGCPKINVCFLVCVNECMRDASFITLHDLSSSLSDRYYYFFRRSLYLKETKLHHCLSTKCWTLQETFRRDYKYIY